MLYLFFFNQKTKKNSDQTRRKNVDSPNYESMEARAYLASINDQSDTADLTKALSRALECLTLYSSTTSPPPYVLKKIISDYNKKCVRIIKKARSGKTKAKKRPNSDYYRRRTFINRYTIANKS